jgi:hypothetical protein
MTVGFGDIRGPGRIDKTCESKRRAMRRGAFSSSFSLGKSKLWAGEILCRRNRVAYGEDTSSFSLLNLIVINVTTPTHEYIY